MPICAEKTRYAHFAEICEKCGKNMRQSHIRSVKLTCLISCRCGRSSSGFVVDDVILRAGLPSGANSYVDERRRPVLDDRVAVDGGRPDGGRLDHLVAAAAGGDRGRAGARLLRGEATQGGRVATHSRRIDRRCRVSQQQTQSVPARAPFLPFLSHFCLHRGNRLVIVL